MSLNVLFKNFKSVYVTVFCYVLCNLLTDFFPRRCFDTPKGFKPRFCKLVPVHQNVATQTYKSLHDNEVFNINKHLHKPCFCTTRSFHQNLVRQKCAYTTSALTCVHAPNDFVPKFLHYLCATCNRQLDGCSAQAVLRKNVDPKTVVIHNSPLKSSRSLGCNASDCLDLICQVPSCGCLCPFSQGNKKI